MDSIRETVDNFLAAAERLKTLTVQINEMADALEPALAGSGALHSVTERVGQISRTETSIASAKFAPGELRPGMTEAEWNAAAATHAPQFPQTPQGAAPSSAPTTAPPTAGAVEVEGPGVAAPETPRPADPSAIPNPFEQAAPAAAPAAEKKGGRRTNEEMAAENGVDLADVKRWLGEGKRVTKGAIEEFAALGRASGPVQRPNPAPLPTAAADPFGNPGPAPVQNNTGVPEPVAPQAPPAPAQQPAAVPPTPENPFGQVPENPWAGQGEAVTDWSPFQ